MGNAAGVRRDLGALARRRMRAARLLEKGHSQSKVALRVGAHRQSVSRWAAELHEKGRKGLKKVGRAGRKPRLSPQQLKKVVRRLESPPELLGYGSGLWTSARVTLLIEREFGVQYHAGHVWRILQQLDWSCQRPTKQERALERKKIKLRRSHLGAG